MDFDKLRAVVDASPLGASIYSMTRDVRVYSNKKTLEFFGADSEEQFNAVPPRELFAETEQAKILDERSDDVLATPRRELRKRLDGSLWISRTTRQRLTLNDDDVFLIWYEDITEFEGSSERFERVFNMPTVPMAMYRVSDRKWIDYNDSFRGLFGYEQAEFDELTWVEITHPDDLEVNESFFQQASDQHAMDSYTLKKRFIHQNGSVIYSRIHTEHIRDVGGTSKYVILVVQDLTEDVERERLIDAQRRDLEFHRQAVNEHSLVSIADRHGRINYVNRLFCDVSGYSEEEILGQDHRILNSGVHPKSFFQDLWATISKGEVWFGDICNRRKDGELYWVSATIVPDVDENGRPDRFIAVRTDITAVKQAEADLADQLAQTVRAQNQIEKHASEVAELAERESALRIAAEAAEQTKSEFLASMSHEIRTPMTGISGFADLLLEDNLPTASREKVEKIRSSVSSLLTIINEILDLSKLDAGKLVVEKVDFDPSKIANDVTQLFYQTCPSSKKDKLNIMAKVSADFPAGVRADPTRLRQILLNLMGNAVKFTDEGFVTLHCEKVPGQDLLKFRVEDTGIGVDQEAREKLFGDFVQADASISRKYQGSGLGLAICQRLVKLMGGEIGMNNAPERGSVFWFTLPYEPLPDGVAISEELLDSTSTIRSIRSLKILVAEDNEVNQTIIAAILDRMGHKCVFANNGVEAVEATLFEDFDLILMDIRMPELSGPAATQKIRLMPGDKGKIPIIAVTADVIADNRQSYFDAGMNGCVSKPINRADLAIAINEAIGETVNIVAALEDTPAEEGNFDFDGICKRLGLPEDVIIELLNKFASDYAELPTRIQELVDGDDLDGVREVAHTLKGVSGSLGLLEISETASKIEMTAKTKNSVSVQEQIPILISATRDAVTAIGLQSKS